MLGEMKYSVVTIFNRLNDLKFWLSLRENVLISHKILENDLEKIEEINNPYWKYFLFMNKCAYKVLLK